MNMRGILLLLCLVVCFLFGLLYGMDHNREVNTDVSKEVVRETVQESPVVAEPPAESTEEVNLVQSDTTPAYKAASALESIVTFFYEIVVELLYQVSKLFY